MTDTHKYSYHHSNMLSTEKMKLASSASEQNVYFTYVCLVNDLIPTTAASKEDQEDNEHNHKMEASINKLHYNEEEETIRVERTKAFHELVEPLKKDSGHEERNNDTLTSDPCPTTTLDENSESDNEGNNFISCDNPNILKLTKMKWLTEDQEDGSDSSSSPSLASSCTSTCSRYSDDETCVNLDDKHLSTILQLDKEHNMFGLSSIAIIGPRPSKQKRSKHGRKPVFHQTAIVQVCCAKGCCKHVSRSDLPTSLKCGSCKSCCFDPICPTCTLMPCSPVCDDPPSCPSLASCSPPNCKEDCTNCFGLKIKINRKQNVELPKVELTPRSSCVLHKPLAARSCYHTPQCIAPSPHFPYLTPCFWPSRPSAPCSTPTRCFHNPPCPPARSRPKVPFPPQYKCPRHAKCDKSKTVKCTNDVCPGNNPVMRKQLESRFGSK